MDKIHVIYGMTEAVADKIAKALDAQAFNINAGDAAAFDAELLVLGSSTWGVGDLQDDWAAQLDAVKANFAGKKVATFGLGDSVGFADSFCVAAETLAARRRGAEARRYERSRPDRFQNRRVGRDAQSRALSYHLFPASAFPSSRGCRVPIVCGTLFFV